MVERFPIQVAVRALVGRAGELAAGVAGIAGQGSMLPDERKEGMRGTGAAGKKIDQARVVQGAQTGQGDDSTAIASDERQGYCILGFTDLLVMRNL